MDKRAIIKLHPNKIKKMKNKNKLNTATLSPSRLSFRALLAIALSTLLVVSSLGFSSMVQADQYDDKINSIQQQNSSAQSSINSLQVQADSYKDAINKYEKKITRLQKIIDKNVAQQRSLQKQINTAQIKLDKQKAFLSKSVRNMYVSDNLSTVEMLATSRNLSDFVDGETYRAAVQSKIQATLKEITKLQNDLRDKKGTVDELLRDQRAQQSQLDNSRAKQAQLLNYNQGQQNSYTAKLAANNKKIQQLRAAQAAAYASTIGSGGTSTTNSAISFKNYSAAQSCGGGYTYCWAGLDEDVNDPWGFNYARECVHYVLDVLDRNGYYIPQFPSGGGNANNWVYFTTLVGAARLVSSPQRGDVAYMPVGSLGHVGVVEYVNGDGTVHISQMNYTPGLYTTMDLYITQGIQFLRFHK